MDDIVRQAMAKWPNVPAVFGWLALDLRGNWLLRGEHIANPLLNEFISRNYEHDAAGRWFFQNGPQRVFAHLSYAPWVLRIGIDRSLATHTGLNVASIVSAWLDENGVAILVTEHGAGTIDDRDADAFSERFVTADGSTPGEDELLRMIESVAAGRESGLHVSHRGARIPVKPIASSEAGDRLGFVRDPATDAAATPSA